MYVGTVGFVLFLCSELIVGEVTYDIKNSTDVNNTTLPESDVKVPVRNGQKDQRRRGMESEMAYPLGYFPPFGGDFQPSTTPYDRVPRRESVPIIIERTMSSQPAIMSRNPVHRIVSNVYSTQPGHQQVYNTNLGGGYQIPGATVLYKPQETISDTAYMQKPLYQQPTYQTYSTYQDTSSYQPQIYQVPQITTVVNRYPNEPNYHSQTTMENQGLQHAGGYIIDQNEDARILEREIQALRELEEQHQKLLQRINARAQGVVYYNSDSSLTRKVIAQYPNDQITPQYVEQPSYSGDTQGTIMIMDRPSQGGYSGIPYSTNQIRISRHPGQIPMPALMNKNKRGMESMKGKSDINLVGQAQMAVPLMIGLKVSPDKNNVWKYIELKSSKRVSSVYQPDFQKPPVPYAELLPPCPGGFLCDVSTPATINVNIQHEMKNPKDDDNQPSRGNEDGKSTPDGQDVHGKPPQTSMDTNTSSSENPETSTTENTAIVTPDSVDKYIPENDDSNSIFFPGPDSSEESNVKGDSAPDIDPRSSAAQPVT